MGTVGRAVGGLEVEGLEVFGLDVAGLEVDGLEVEGISSAASSSGALSSDSSSPSSLARSALEVWDSASSSFSSSDCPALSAGVSSMCSNCARGATSPSLRFCAFHLLLIFCVSTHDCLSFLATVDVHEHKSTVRRSSPPRRIRRTAIERKMLECGRLSLHPARLLLLRRHRLCGTDRKCYRGLVRSDKAARKRRQKMTRAVGELEREQASEGS